MKKGFLFALALLAAGVAGAQVGTSFVTGGIAYTITSDSTVEVGQKGCVAGSSPYSGAVNIPATVARQGVTYRVTAVGEYAFLGCNVSSVTLPNTITTLKKCSFYAANNLSSVTLPASVREIGQCALVALRLSLQVDPASPYFTTVDGILYSKDTTTLVVCPQSKSGTVQLPSCVESIAETGFYDCEQLTSILLPPALKEIGEMAFTYCLGLTGLVIPASVRSIDVNPFAGCEALTNLSLAEGNSRYVVRDQMIMNAAGDSVVSCHRSGASVALPDGVRYVGGFCLNTGLTQITLPESVEEVAHNAFEGCTSLSQVALPQRLSLMGKEAFYGCEALAEVRIPDGLRVVDSDAFHGCSRLERIEWGDAVERVESGAFLLCRFSPRLVLPATLRHVGMDAFGVSGSPLRQVVFTSAVDSICGWAFSENRLTSLRLRNLPETDEYGALSYCSLDSLVIPCGMRAQFEAHPYWGQFAGKLYEDCDGIEQQEVVGLIVAVDGRELHIRNAQGEVSLYDLSGRRLYSSLITDNSPLTIPLPAPGLYLLRTAEGSRKVVAR